jgi:hypothetical protein
MSSREPPLFAATALPAGLLAIGLTTALAATHHVPLAARLPAIAATTLLALASYRLSFATNGRVRSSLEFGYLIAAALALPFPAAMIAGSRPFVGTALRSDRSAGGFRRITRRRQQRHRRLDHGAPLLLAAGLTSRSPRGLGSPRCGSSLRRDPLRRHERGDALHHDRVDRPARRTSGASRASPDAHPARGRSRSPSPLSYRERSARTTVS